MKISELSTRSGVTTASIKYYLREGLLFSGTSTSPTQTEYDEAHVARLRLIRALIDVGGLTISAAKAVITVADDKMTPLVQAFGVAQAAVSASLQSTAEPSEKSLAAVSELESARGWKVHGHNPGQAITARVLDAFDAIGRPEMISLLEPYAAAADLAAEADLAAVMNSDPADRNRMVETVIVGTALGDGLFAGLRRIAQESKSLQLGLAGSPTAHNQSPTESCEPEGARS